MIVLYLDFMGSLFEYVGFYGRRRTYSLRKEVMSRGRGSEKGMTSKVRILNVNGFVRLWSQERSTLSRVKRRIRVIKEEPEYVLASVRIHVERPFLLGIQW